MNIPNTLTVLRLLLTPCFALLLGQGRRREALAVLVLAALSDGLDGFLARRLRQTTELGKILDPVADKLMQLTMMLCALQRVPRMWWLLALHLVREGCLGALGAAALRRGCPVPGARWYGKTCTAVLYAVAYIYPSEVDSLHLTPEGHRILAEKLSELVKRICAE